MTDDTHVQYQDRLVPKAGFRAFIYRWNQELHKVEAKLVNSWDKYELNISTKIWLSRKEEAQNVSPKDEKPSKKRGE